MSSTSVSSTLVRTTVDSPIGDLLLVAGDNGLLRLAFSNEDWDSVVVSLMAGVGAGASQPIDYEESLTSADGPKAASIVETAAEELALYFDKELTRFQTPLDLSLSKGFRHTVVEYLRTIPFGSTESYADVAKAVGNPNAVRAVGSACSHNPIPIFVPCHRVLTSSGRVGGYLGGTAAKDYLLALEGILVPLR